MLVMKTSPLLQSVLFEFDSKTRMFTRHYKCIQVIVKKNIVQTEKEMYPVFVKQTLYLHNKCIYG
jgi:hypothetical protein